MLRQIYATGHRFVCLFVYTYYFTLFIFILFNILFYYIYFLLSYSFLSEKINQYCLFTEKARNYSYEITRMLILQYYIYISS